MKTSENYRFYKLCFCQYRLTLIVNDNILILNNKIKQLTVQRNSSPSSNYASTELKLATTSELTDDEQAVQTTPSQRLILKAPDVFVHVSVQKLQTQQ